MEASLKRLGLDYIDLYWVHVWDSLTPIEEMMRALDDLVRAGKILYVGVSDAPAWVVSRANTMAELRDWSAVRGAAGGVQPDRTDAGAGVDSDGAGTGDDDNAMVAAGGRDAGGQVQARR